ncbi:MAG: AraC family transcriptional regulator [Bradyrhizobium sp.]|nr:AraC family transcriptional regulator [Bradyrhizobium sp.]
MRFPAYEHVKFIAVLRGRFDLLIEGEARSSRLRRGDCYMLTSGRPYRIFNAPVPERDAATLYAADRAADSVVRWGEGVVDTVTVGARASFFPVGVAYLRDRLPPFVRIPAAATEAARFRALLELLCGEVEGGPGTTFAADRYVGLLLVEALRYLVRNGHSFPDQNAKSSATP